MQRIWNFFENMDELMYVSDMDSYELLYMNKKALDTYGFASLEEIKGMKCYEVLHGSSTPCSACNNCELSEGQFKEWQYYSPRLNKYLKVKDTMMVNHGRRCRIELALDISAQEHQDKVIRGYQNLETLANEALRIALRASTPDQTLQVFLEYIGKALKGERTYIFEKNARGGDDNTYEWVANGITPEKENLQNLPCEICANWYRAFKENRTIRIRNLEDIRESDPLQYDNLKRQDIHSLVVVPLYDDKEIIGFYGVDNPPVEEVEYTEDMLQIMAHFIISSIKRRELVKKLEKMSYTDPLTMIGNRFAMDQYVADMDPNTSVGIVYCDITGLKEMNDREGHIAGDRLILRACDSLKAVFRGYGLFRIGGDEFLAICPGMEREVFEAKVKEMKSNMFDNHVTMAVGAVWKADAKENIDMLLSQAEKIMYAEKDKYYEMTGKNRRRV